MRSLSAAGRKWCCGHWWAQLCFGLEPLEGVSWLVRSPGVPMGRGQGSPTVKAGMGQGPCSAVVDRGPCSTVLPQPPGLEPEIQKLIAKHKQEVKKLKGLHATELLQAEERAAQHYGRQAEELREHLEREKEALGRQEWERAQQRWGSRGHGWCAQTPRVNSTSFLAASFQDQRNLGVGGGGG